MQPVPEGYKPLGFAGFTDKGGYSASEVYAENDIVHKDNTTWRCLLSGTTGITPEEGENWTVFIASTTASSGITTTDTEGIVGPAGENVSNQSIIDALSERAVSDRAMLSDAFSAEKAYAVGDYAIYGNNLYKFTSAKTAGPWDTAKVQAVTVAGELNSLSEDLASANTQIVELNGNLTAKINKSDTANNLTTTASGKVLDARQGKVLSDKIKNIITIGQIQKTYSVQANSHADISETIPSKTGYTPLVAVLLTTNAYNVYPLSINIDNGKAIAVVYNPTSTAITNAIFVWNIIYVKN